MLQSLRSLFGPLVRRSLLPADGTPLPTPPSEPAPAPPAADGIDTRREAIERLTGRPIGDLQLYERALTHRSMLRGQPESHLASNERLEFLGDAALGFVVAEHIHALFPGENEGFLTRLRAKLVNGAALSECALRAGLDRVVLISENMEETGGRSNQTILADAFEAVIGALYLDQGLDAARDFIRLTVLETVDLSALATRQDNFKSLLLEHAQAHGLAQPTYRVVSEDGPSHEKTFTVEVILGGEPRGRGSANNKKLAEQNAAREALERLQSDVTAAAQ